MREKGKKRERRGEKRRAGGEGARQKPVQDRETAKKAKDKIKLGIKRKRWEYVVQRQRGSDKL